MIAEHRKAGIDLPAWMGPRPRDLDKMKQWKAKAVSTFTLIHSVDLELNHELVCGSVWGELKRDKKELRRKCRVRVRTSTGFSFYIRAQSSCR
jgi:hypothetical protein